MTPDGQPATSAGLHPETAVICAGRPGHAAGGPLNVPVVLASNFQAGTMAAPGTREGSRAYSRTDATPTWEALETAVGQVEGGHAVAFSSGMAAIAAVLDLVPSGSRIVAPEDCYFGVGELLADGQQQGRWAVDRVDLTDTAAVQAAVAAADLLWLETPSNPLLEVADLPALCAAGRRAGAIVGVDNTFATPLLQQPLALGADVVVHSATKFIGGHSDLLSGITIAREQALAGRLRHRRGLTGATPGALEGLPGAARPAHPGPAARPRPAQRRRTRPPARRAPRRQPCALPRPTWRSRAPHRRRADDRLRGSAGLRGRRRPHR